MLAVAGALHLPGRVRQLPEGGRSDNLGVSPTAALLRGRGSADATTEVLRCPGG
jgi:hypothetical protein